MKPFSVILSFLLIVGLLPSVSWAEESSVEEDATVEKSNRSSLDQKGSDVSSGESNEQSVESGSQDATSSADASVSSNSDNKADGDTLEVKTDDNSGSDKSADEATETENAQSSEDASADSSTDEGEFTYEISGSSVTITGYTGYLPSLEVPSEIDGLEVTAIAEEAFKDFTWLEEVALPSTLKSLGQGAFKGCVSLKAVSIPDNVTSIPDYCFRSCSALAAVDIPEGVSSIGFMAFMDCGNLSGLQLPSTLETIAGSAFDDCDSLLAVDVPEGVESIGSCAFLGCGKLKAVSLPASLTDVDSYAFSNLPSGSVIAVKSVRLYYKLSGNELYVSNKSTSVVANIVDDNKVSYQIIDDVSSVAGYSGTEASVGVQSALSDEVETEDSSEVTVSYDVKAIGEGSFEGSSIQSVVLPEGITSIGDRAFANSSSLTNLTVSNDKDSDDDTISMASIDDCNDAVVAVLPSTVTSIGAQAFSSCVAIKDLDIPSSVQSIGDDAFQGMGADTTILVHTATAYEQAVAACSNSKATVVYGTSDDKYTYDMSGVAFDGATFEYDGSPHSVFVSGDLPDGVSVSYSGNGVVDSGRHTVTASFEVDEGACNPIPDMTAEIEITPKKIGAPSASQGLVYDGGVKTGVEDGEGYVRDGVYSASAAGSYSAKVTPVANYCWEDGTREPVEVAWSIAKRPATITVNAASKIFGEQDPGFSGGVDGLVSAGDLGDVAYGRAAGDEGKEDAGSDVTVTASYTTNGNYEVEVVPAKLAIEAKGIDGAEVNLEEGELAYDGSAVEPAVRSVVLADGTELSDADYDISYSDNDKPGTATVAVEGKGNYRGTASATFVIGKRTYDMSGVAFDGATFEYDGSPHSVFVSGDLPDGVSVSYSGNGVVDSGRHTVTASFEVDEGACNPIPDMTAEMTVVKKPGYISFVQPFVTKIYGIGSFNNQVKKLGDGAVYYSSSNPSIVSVDVSGTLKVRGVGRATVTASLAEGKNYLSSSASFSVVVNPEGTKITKLIKKKKGFTAKWSKRTTQTDGYQIRYSAKKNMTKSKSVVVGKAKTVTKAIKKLKKKTTYYVQIRTYKKVGGVKFYSAWSSSKKVKTK